MLDKHSKLTKGDASDVGVPGDHDRAVVVERSQAAVAVVDFQEQCPDGPLLHLEGDHNPTVA